MLDELERAKLHPDVLRNLAKNNQLKKAEAYSEDNPPPYPVRSVNGQTGDVTVSGISALDVYPVGSIYMSVNSTNPGTLFGGTWEQLEDRFLLGAGTTYTAGDTGGEATHTLTVDEMPSHTHGQRSRYSASNGSYTPAFPWVSDNGTERQAKTMATGGDQPHNNMPPYLAVYMWKRTA